MANVKMTLLLLVALVGLCAAQYPQYGEGDRNGNVFPPFDTPPGQGGAYYDYEYPEGYQTPSPAEPPVVILPAGQDVTPTDALLLYGPRPVQPVKPVEPEPTEPGLGGCREEQYVCTRLYSVQKPCRECLHTRCFYRGVRVYVMNKELCVRTVCEQDQLAKANLCRDQYSHCGLYAGLGFCGDISSSCGKSCHSC